MRKDKQELHRRKGRIRAGKGVPGRGYNLCKGPEVVKKKKKTENAGHSRGTNVAAEIEGERASEAAGELGGGQTLQVFRGVGRTLSF